MASAEASLSNFGDAVRRGQQRRARPFVTVPRVRRGHVDCRIGIGQPAVIAAEQVATLRRGQELRERAPRLGKHVAHPVHEPVELRGSREEDAAQHESETALRMRLGVRERQRRAPRAAEQQPTARSRDARAGARDRRRGARVVLSASSATGVERPAPRWSTSTIRQKLRIEIATMMGKAPAARVRRAGRRAARLARCRSIPRTACAGDRPRGVRSRRDRSPGRVFRRGGRDCRASGGVRSSAQGASGARKRSSTSIR